MEDRATGIELQIIDLVERRDRLRHEGWNDDAAAVERDIAALQLELADVADHLAESPATPLRVLTSRAQERLAS